MGHVSSTSRVEKLLVLNRKKKCPLYNYCFRWCLFFPFFYSVLRYRSDGTKKEPIKISSMVKLLSLIFPKIPPPLWTSIFRPACWNSRGFGKSRIERHNVFKSCLKSVARFQSLSSLPVCTWFFFCFFFRAGGQKVTTCGWSAAQRRARGRLLG